MKKIRFMASYSFLCKFICFFSEKQKLALCELFVFALHTIPQSIYKINISYYGNMDKKLKILYYIQSRNKQS